MHRTSEGEAAISEVVGTVLIVVLVIALAAVLAAVFLGYLQIPGKTAYIVPRVSKVNLNGTEVIRLEHGGGDLVYLDPSSRDAGYELGTWMDSAQGSVQAVPGNLTKNVFGPGGILYIYPSGGSWRMTDSPGSIPAGGGSLPAGPLAMRLVDETNHVLIARIGDLGGSTGPTTVPTTPGSPIVAAFSASPASGVAPLQVQFTDQSTGGPTTWSWTFGDEGTSTVQNPVHPYTTPGNYTVTLNASNSAGSDTEAKTGYIVISAPPAPFSNQLWLNAQSKPGRLVDGTYLKFRYTGSSDPWAGRIDFPGGAISLQNGDIVRIAMNGDQYSGILDMNNNQITALTYNVRVYTNNNPAPVQSGVPSGIYISRFDSYESTLTFLLPAMGGQTYLQAGGTVIIPYYPENTSAVTVSGIGQYAGSNTYVRLPNSEVRASGYYQV